MNRIRAGIAPFAACGLLAVLAACGRGGEETKPVRVSLEFWDVLPKPPADGYSVVSEDGKTTVPLVREEGRETEVYAAKVPGGRYRLACPAGWGAVGPYEPPLLRADLPPQRFAVGRAHTIYVLAQAGYAVTDVEVTRTSREAGGTVNVEVVRDVGADGRAALRVPPSEWRGALLLVTRLNAATLTRPAGVRLSDDGAPRYVIADPAPNVPLDVVAIHAPGGDPAANREVAVSVRLGRLVTRAVGTTDARGRVRIDEVPQDAEDAWIEVPQSGGPPLRFPGRRFRFLGEARLMVPSGDPAEAGMLSVRGWPRPDATVQARAAGGGGWAALPGVWSAEEKGHRFDCALPAGRYALLVTDDPGAARSQDFVEVEAGGRRTVDVTPQPACIVSVHIRGGFPTTATRYDLLARRVEDGVPSELVGGTLRFLSRHDATLTLPAGSYLLRLERDGVPGFEKPLTLDAPGTRAAVELDAPR